MGPRVETFPCVECPEGKTRLTGSCDSCGATYRRGYLVSKGAAVRAKVPAVAARSKALKVKLARCPTCGKATCGALLHRPWTSWQEAVTAEGARKALFAFYDAHPGNRRTRAEEAFAVISVERRDPLPKRDDEARVAEGRPASWIVTVRKI